MSDTTTVSLQITVLKRTRNRFKAEAANLDLDMSELGQALLDWFADAAPAGKLPPALQQFIAKAKKPAEGKE